MEFEWDEDKRQRIWRERGIDILRAALIFEGPVLTKADDRRDYGEERLISIGLVDGTCYVVVHTRRESTTRLVTAWKGGRHDRELYQARIARRTPADE